MTLRLPLLIIFLFLFKAKADTQSLIDLAESGNISAQIELADEYFYNADSQKSRNMALRWYIKAMHLSGRLSILKRIEFLQNIVENSSFTIPNMNASLLFQPSQNATAELLYVSSIAHLKGLGIKADLDKSQQLLKRSANRGFGQAQLFLANTFRDGIFQKPSRTMHYFWLTQAEKADHPEATYQLATLYLSSNSIVEKNKSKAILLLEKSALLGNIKAQTLHKSLTRTRY